MEPSAGMVHDLILDRHLRRLDARLLLRNEVGIPRNSVHQVNELAHDGHERPFGRWGLTPLVGSREAEVRRRTL